jgi:hypothetical protein
MENEFSIPLNPENKTDSHARRSRYRIANHHEAGLFDTMTGATLWALKNLKDWDWRIETVPGAL